MSTLLIGDIHGCYKEFRALLRQAEFNPLHDTLWLTGDLVARGPDSIEVLRYVKSLGNSVRIVLGNHDLHLLAVHSGVISNQIRDKTAKILEAPDVDILLNWLRCQPLIQIDSALKLVMTHAGINPQWDLETAHLCAKEVEAALVSDRYFIVLKTMYGDLPNKWAQDLTGLSRLRFFINTLTRMRYCFSGGDLDMIFKDSPRMAPSELKPWFNFPNKIINTGYSITFGHWASLEGQGTPPLIYPLDTGCCWGGKLTMLRWEDKKYFTHSCLHIKDVK
ncbi:bis(5'-nucleosyl)-tetraphosphatase (symmetrical) ApaH [Candidatus Profftia tarda]|uniref:Bis(5'-nucleosyl)-tetraphosphatase, symmetrical n=1 Tax=Candidatus Profftia tarda TaxID=1177216 RepID=A0A8E4EY11_9ENTR|nr:bis(5'-nucleosyl)-tetraphosphatase (symmetrical) ApaH [Candidatus Profftia tarda]CAD6508106.1 Bis(5'-nucleosyl)-tetraphosphatase, symmetrical [Candidatus Profftia tarda]